MRTLERSTTTLQPVTLRLPPARMIVAHTVGDPADLRSHVLDALYAAAAAVHGRDELVASAGGPRVRWPRAQVGPPDRWEARWAIPILGDGLGALSTYTEIPTQVELWMYGPVVQVMHDGPQETKPLAVRALDEFAFHEGLHAPGWYEEEYVGDPWDPDDTTIIRYAVTG